MTAGKIGLWKTAIIIVGFPAAYMIFGTTDAAQGLFARHDRDFYIPFWGGIMALHWLSVAAVAVALKSSGRRFSDIGLKLSRTGLLWAALVFGVVALAVFGGVEFILNTSGFDAAQARNLPGLIPVSSGERLFFILLVFSTGFCEEITYRGFAITALADAGINRWAGAVIAALLFVGIHGVNAYSNRFLFLFGGGLMFGLLFLATRNLLPSIVLHLAINLSAMLTVLPPMD